MGVGFLHSELMDMFWDDLLYEHAEAQTYIERQKKS